MQTSHRHLPIELWHIVILHLGDSPYRNGLRLLLTVSRAMHGMVIPLIYQSIVIDNQDKVRNIHLQQNKQPSTYLWSSCVHLLHSALISNPSLAKHVKTFVETDIDFAPENQIYHILPRLTNLKRLHIVNERGRDMRAFLSSSTSTSTTFTSTPVLTHFSCTTFTQVDFKVVQSFILSHRTSLTFLSLSSMSDTLAHLPPSCLERLHTFKSGFYPATWNTITNTAPVRHLEATAFSTRWVKDPKVVFRNLVSLRIDGLYETDAIKIIGPYLQSLEWLYLCFFFKIDQHLDANDFMNIASPGLSYIHFWRKTSTTTSPPQPRYSWEDLQPLYNHHPRLRVIDIAYRGVQANIPSSSLGATVSRYFRDQIKLTREDVIVPSPWIFEGWWEPMKAELELE